MQPLIGITGFRHTISTSVGPGLLAVVSADDYAQGVENAGGVPVVIPYVETQACIQTLAHRLDGLVLGGGEDVDPFLFGESPKAGLGEVVPERDALEISLIQEMMSVGKPILGICRGMQVLNVALGGTLYQDLSREWPGQNSHSQRAPRNHLSHVIRIEPDSRLTHCLGQVTTIRCNSFHHQAVKELAPSLVPVAWDDEGLVEAMESPDGPFLVAVQWHPENLWRTSPAHLGLFRGLVKAAQKND